MNMQAVTFRQSRPAFGDNPYDSENYDNRAQIGEEILRAAVVGFNKTADRQKNENYRLKADLMRNIADNHDTISTQIKDELGKQILAYA